VTSYLTRAIPKVHIAIAIRLGTEASVCYGMLQSAESANRSHDQDGKDRLWTTKRTLNVCLGRPL